MSSPKRDQDTAGASLRPAQFHILLALSSSPRHGLGIADEVLETSGGAMRLGPGTLYRSLKELLESKLVSEVEAPPGDEDPRRKFYRMTAEGKRRLRAEAERYESLVDVARRRAVLPSTR